jgi:AraC-like DNA-binding protein
MWRSAVAKLPISTMAYRTKYADPIATQFSRAFRAQFGYSPRKIQTRGAFPSPSPSPSHAAIIRSGATTFDQCVRVKP